MIDWNDNAKAAVREFAKFVGHRDGASFWLSDKGVIQTKTVADAVADHDGEWPFSSGIILMGYSPKHEHYFAFGDGYELTGGECIVCTREQFEAYVKDKEFTKALSECAKESEGILKALAEQEGEKWTHTTSMGKCKVIKGPNNSGQYLLEFEGGVWDCLYAEQLKPIKPTMTVQEEAALVEFMKSSHKLEVVNEVRAYIREHEITEGPAND
ncbi:MAG: hypothetical protein CMP19_05110 [Rickettsiales bacterium]|nr:hypothetical protein [Rickettsiales bacterium]